MKRPVVQIALRILVTALTLAWFIRGLHPESLPDRMAAVRWAMVIPAFLVNSLWVLPSAMRWRGIAALAGYHLRFRDAVRFFLVGSFFNAFLPTGHGGDVVRGVLASRKTGHPAGGMLGTILAERLIGMAVSASFVAFGGLAFRADSRVPPNVWFSAAVLLCGMAAAAALLVSRRFRSVLKSGLRIVPSAAFHDGARQAGRVLDACRRKPGALAGAVGWSAANQLVPILSGWMLTFAIPGLETPFRAFMVVMPLSFVSVLLPSIGGYGVREAGFILFLGWFGVAAGPAAVFGMVRLLFLWMFALAGAGVYISGWHARERASVRSAIKRRT
ncbi:flippase-like domain-containing protein [bacterium]|nr:flippase-like domain-containing protein [bacterium]